MFLRLSLFALLAFPSLSAQPREWKSEDGSRTFKGEYVSREGDRVTIKRGDGNALTFPLAKLHPEDREWINRHHPLEGVPGPAPRKTSAFGNLVFGDTREEVYSKLEESLLVAELPDAGSFGNAEFKETLRTKEQLGGLDCFILFGWNDAGLLDEVTLITDTLPAPEYRGKLQKAWNECVDLLNNLHGKPVQAVGLPDVSRLQEGTVAGTHLWNLEEAGTAIVGVTRKDGDFAVVVRFSRQPPKPAAGPIPPP